VVAAPDEMEYTVPPIVACKNGSLVCPKPLVNPRINAL